MSTADENMTRDDEWFQNAGQVHDAALYDEIRKSLQRHSRMDMDNLAWLYDNMHPYFFVTMKEEIDAIVALASSLENVASNRKIILVDQPNKLILARQDLPGSLYDTLKTLQEQEISYAEMTHSYGKIPGSQHELEVQRFEFERKSHADIAGAGNARIHRKTRNAVFDQMKRLYPTFDFKEFDEVLRLLWLNNQAYVRISPPERIARILWLLQECKNHDGLYFDVENKGEGTPQRETRLLFSVENPPQKGFHLWRQVPCGIKPCQIHF